MTRGAHGASNHQRWPPSDLPASSGRKHLPDIYSWLDKLLLPTKTPSVARHKGIGVRGKTWACDGVMVCWCGECTPRWVRGEYTAACWCTCSNLKVREVLPVVSLSGLIKKNHRQVNCSQPPNCWSKTSTSSSEILDFLGLNLRNNNIFFAKIKH